jgi:hypothetical protein
VYLSGRDKKDWVLAVYIWQQGIVLLTGADVDMKGGHHNG